VVQQGARECARSRNGIFYDRERHERARIFHFPPFHLSASATSVVHRDWSRGGGVAGVSLQSFASCFGLPGRGVLSPASIRGRLGYAHKTMHRMVLSAEGGSGGAKCRNEGEGAATCCRPPHAMFWNRLNGLDKRIHKAVYCCYRERIVMRRCPVPIRRPNHGRVVLATYILYEHSFAGER
jgi:hypothetical protein